MEGVVRRERKVVTVVFCDLVGFTERSDQLDPEDVEAFLRPYHARLRSELERYGGTVEKFIGDAVMALFGAPAAHEDDPERAVRACLAIRDWAVDEGGVQVRIAVTTGEVLIRLDARPGAGEGMASGDIVNTASRLQNAAPVNGLLADETTYRATRRVIDYREAPAVDAKGKAEPIAVWEAVSARSRLGVDIAHEARTELVGRERELAVLRDALARACHEEIPQLVTLVGVPGMGKSRLVYELSRIADAEPELIAWRQGRCLAYGDGVTLWALAEIVKAQAGILEQDTPDEVRDKIRQTVADVLSGSTEEAWVQTHLLSLVGLSGEAELGGDRRSEAFAAWRRLLEGLAEQAPLILVFEDLHWADETLLDFVDELCDWVTDAPLLVIATARPELLERRPGWGGGKLNATTLALTPLTEEQTAFLIGRLIDSPLMAVESQQALLERAGGNPLYAEQFADLFLERGSVDDAPVPESLQGLIAARLDGATADEKTVLQTAAVIGKTFWASALGHAGGDVASTLHSLERKGFVRRQKRSSVESETEFAFAHALVRDVAYAQIPRAERSAKHRNAAQWIEDLGRPEDHAELLAFHWSASLELARASGAEEGDLADRARVALRESGDRAFALNAYPAAEKYYEDALELWPRDDPDRPALIFRRAQALLIAADERRVPALEEARDALLAAGDRAGAAEAEAFLAQVAWYEGRREDGLGHLREARDYVEGTGASAGATRVLAVSARYRMLAGERAEGLELGREALAMAEGLGLEELRAHALITVGTAKYFLGDDSGVADLEQALAIGLATNSPIAGNALNNLGVVASADDLRREHDLFEESLQLAERMGDRDTMRFAEGNLVWSDWALGDWDAALARADAFIAACEAGNSHYLEDHVRATRATIWLARGDGEAALGEYAVALELSAGDPQGYLPNLGRSARAHLLLGRIDEARALAEDFLATAEASEDKPPGVAIIASFAAELDLPPTTHVIVSMTPFGLVRDAALAELDGDFAGAADTYATLGFRAAEADARLEAAKRLLETGRSEDGEAQLEQALAFYRAVGAVFFVERCEALVRTAYRDSA